MGNRLVCRLNAVSNGLEPMTPEVMFDCASNAPIPRIRKTNPGANYFLEQALGALNPRKMNAFTDGSQLRISFEVYLQRLTDLCPYTHVSPTVYLLAVHYLDKIMDMNPSLFLHCFNGHRLVLGAFIAAFKYHEDCCGYMNDLARMALLSKDELIKIEREFLTLLKYELFVDEKAFAALEEDMLQEALGPIVNTDAVLLDVLNREMILGFAKARSHVEIHGSHLCHPVRLEVPLVRTEYFHGVHLECDEDVHAANYLSLRFNQQVWFSKRAKFNGSIAGHFAVAVESYDPAEEFEIALRAEPTPVTSNGWDTDSDDDEWIIEPPPPCYTKEEWLRRFEPPSSAECTPVSSPKQAQRVPPTQPPVVELPSDEEIANSFFFGDLLSSETPPPEYPDDTRASTSGLLTAPTSPRAPYAESELDSALMKNEYIDPSSILPFTEQSESAELKTSSFEQDEFRVLAVTENQSDAGIPVNIAAQITGSSAPEVITPVDSLGFTLSEVDAGNEKSVLNVQQLNNVIRRELIDRKSPESNSSIDESEAEKDLCDSDQRSDHLMEIALSRNKAAYSEPDENARPNPAKVEATEQNYRGLVIGKQYSI